MCYRKKKKVRNTQIEKILVLTNVTRLIKQRILHNGLMWSINIITFETVKAAAHFQEKHNKNNRLKF